MSIVAASAFISSSDIAKPGKHLLFEFFHQLLHAAFVLHFEKSFALLKAALDNIFDPSNFVGQKCLQQAKLLALFNAIEG